MAGSQNNWFTSLFSWGRSQSDNDTNEKTRINRTTRAITDFTDKWSVNPALTNGIYNNTYRGLKLAGFGFNIINVPVSFMGLPVVECDNPEAQEFLNDLIAKRTRECRLIHTQSHRDGTIWIYPKYSDITGLEWEMIPDQNVKKIVRNLKTGELSQITTEEEITLNSESSDTEITLTKKVVYTDSRIITTYEGGILPAGVSNSITRNPAGVMPVPFSNNADPNMSRGHSDYERILSDLKSYHDVFLAAIQGTAKFSSKMVQTVKDFKSWCTNNGFGTDGSGLTDLDIGAIDFIVNMEGEKTEFIHPTDLANAYQIMLKIIFHKMVELSGIPEIAWGLKTEGNLASVEENMAILMQYCKDKQEQKIHPYKVLLSASARLLSIAGVIPDAVELYISWDVLNATSETTRAQVFKDFAEALNKLIDKAAMTKDQLFRFWKINFPGITEEDFDAWETGIDKMTAHVVKAKSSATDLLELQGLNE